MIRHSNKSLELRLGLLEPWKRRIVNSKRERSHRRSKIRKRKRSQRMRMM